MGSFLLVVVAAIILSGILFGAAAFTLGRDRGLTPPRPDGVPFDLPADRPLDRNDVEELRFDTTIRGYRMAQVDELLLRVADDFDFLHARIIDLEDQLAAHGTDANEDEERPFEFPWDADAEVDPDAPAAARPAVAGADPVAADDTEAEPAAAEPVGTEPVGTEPVGTEPVGTEPVGAASAPSAAEAGTTTSGLTAAGPDASGADSRGPEAPSPVVPSADVPSADVPGADVPGSRAEDSPAGTDADPQRDAVEEPEIAGPRSGRGR